ncbi:ATP-binding protein [Oxalobacteraceae bacterium R-40]|uniref:ATP-binding protein n=1 Tax=Keguizhuia sedimenti TaxID=3064264 RepID=A0ABU1BIS3_9BURK|nr:ATP-binding protein [Oxalobacteraceae bacterium R-40]
MPKSVQSTGIDRLLILELIAKCMFISGKINLSSLSSRLKLSINVLNEVLGFMVAEKMAEVVRRGASDVDVEYQLSTAGKQRAAEFMTSCRYVGPAPVTLEAYRRMVEKHSVRGTHVVQQDMASAFSDLNLNSTIRDQIGAAMNSGRPLFLYGPPGSGKTYIAEKLGRLMQGLVPVPYAITVENEIIQVFDPLVHHPVNIEPSHDSIDRQAYDGRWLLCERPVVLTGGELTLEMLELRYDYHTGFYQAPPHFKANNGIFIVDDLGRQQVKPKDLMNRWIVPLDRGCDYLTLHTGYKFVAPFDLSVIFSTNIHPAELADEAFMRRLGYKIHIGPLSEEEYRNVFRQHSYALGINYDEAAFRYLVDDLHAKNSRPLLACYPRDLLNQITDYARFYSEPRVMCPQALKRVWHTYFAQNDNLAKLKDKGMEWQPAEN